MKIAMIGGGSTYTPELMEGLIKYHEQLNLKELFLLDIKESEQKFNIVADLCERMVVKAGNPFVVKRGYDPVEAIEGSDFVVQQWRAGLLQGRVKDEKIPLKYGIIGQETTGIGGFTCALRGFPIVEKYVDLVKKHTDNAYIINFANPSGLISEFAINYLNYDKFIGLCNVPINMVNHVAEKFNVSRDDVFLRYYGLNHLSWVDQLLVNGKDMTKESMEDLFRPENIPNMDSYDKLSKVTEMSMNAYLRYYYTTPQMLSKEMEELDGKGTRGEQVQKIENELLKLYSDTTLDEKPSQLSERGGSMYSTAAVELIKDLYTGTKRLHIVNVRNEGAVSNLPDDYVLEVNAMTSKNKAFTVGIGEIPKLSMGLIHTIKSFERLTAEAYLEKSREKAMQAMLIHPLGPRGEDVEKLFNELIEANSDYIKVF